MASRGRCTHSVCWDARRDGSSRSTLPDDRRCFISRRRLRRGVRTRSFECAGGSSSLALAAAACVRAQQPTQRPRIILLHPASVEESTVYQRLVPGLAQLGYVDGKTVTLDLRSGNGITSAFRSSLQTQSPRSRGCDRGRASSRPRGSRRHPDGTHRRHRSRVGSRRGRLDAHLVAAGHQHDGAVPRPHRNVRQVAAALREAVPGVRDVAFLWDAATGQAQLTATRNAAAKLGLPARTIAVDDWTKFESVMSAAMQSRPQAIVVLSSPVAFQFSAPLAEFTKKHRLPAISPFRPFTQSGGLMSYGPDLDLFLRVAHHGRSHPARREPGGHRCRAAGEVRARDQRRGRARSQPHVSRALLLRADEVIR